MGDPRVGGAASGDGGWVGEGRGWECGRSKREEEIKGMKGEEKRTTGWSGCTCGRMETRGRKEGLLLHSPPPTHRGSPE